MPKFKYIGDHDEIMQHDIVFKRGEAVEVTDNQVIRVKKGVGKLSHIVVTKISTKLRGNSHFEEVLEVEQPKEQPPEPEKKKPGRPKGVKYGGYKGADSNKSTPKA